MNDKRRVALTVFMMLGSVGMMRVWRFPSIREKVLVSGTVVFSVTVKAEVVNGM